MAVQVVEHERMREDAVCKSRRFRRDIRGQSDDRASSVTVCPVQILSDSITGVSRVSAKRATDGVEQAELQEFDGTLGKMRSAAWRGSQPVAGLRP